MINKHKNRFTNSIDKNEFELGDKARLMQDAMGALTPSGDLVKPVYTDKQISEFIVPCTSERKGDEVKKFIGRLTVVSPTELTNKQIGEIISSINRAAVGHNIEGLESILKPYQKEQEIRSQYAATYAIKEKELSFAKALNSWQTDNKIAIQSSVISEQKEANRLKGKELDMASLDMNEFKALDVIVKYQLQDPENFKKFDEVIKGGDKVAAKDLVVLETALAKDGKYHGAKGVVNDALQKGITGFIGENSEAILKYEKAKAAIHSLGAAKSVPAQPVTKEIELK